MFSLTFTVGRKAGPEISRETGPPIGAQQTIARAAAELTDRVEAEIPGAAAGPAVGRRGDFPAGLQ